MVEQMSKAIMTPVNKKIAFLTFKIVEETVKRACLKVQVEKLMPVQPDTLRSLKKSMNESAAGQLTKSGLAGSLNTLVGMQREKSQPPGRTPLVMNMMKNPSQTVRSSS